MACNRVASELTLSQNMAVVKPTKKKQLLSMSLAMRVNCEKRFISRCMAVETDSEETSESASSILDRSNPSKLRDWILTIKTH